MGRGAIERAGLRPAAPKNCAHTHRETLTYTRSLSSFYWEWYVETTLPSPLHQVFEELDWAAAHDEEAAAIAAEGVRTAETYLTGNGRTCYWYR